MGMFKKSPLILHMRSWKMKLPLRVVTFILKKMELSVPFQNTPFGPDHIRNCVSDYPVEVEGWLVTFCENPFGTATFVCNEEKTYKKMLMFCYMKLKECSKFACNKV